MPLSTKAAVVGRIRALAYQGLLKYAPKFVEEKLGHELPEHYRKRRCFFIHVPKAAGSSLAMALYGRQIGHKTFRYWEERFPYSSREFFSFAVLREPLSRFNSAFFFLKNGGMNDLDKNFAKNYLNDFESPNDLAEALIEKTLQEKILAYPHFQPQFDFVCDRSFQVGVKLLIPLVSIKDGIEEVSQKIDFEIPSIHLNEGSKKAKQPGQISLSPNSQNILALIYREDFELYARAQTKFAAESFS